VKRYLLGLALVAVTAAVVAAATRDAAMGATGTITTVAGNNTFCGDSGPAASACLNLPVAITFDGSGNLFIADNDNQRVRKVTASTGNISTIAGIGQGPFCGDNGAATSACMEYPIGIVVDGGGNLYIADSNNDRVRKVSGGTITTFAGSASCSGGLPLGDGGLATAACLDSPRGLALNAAGDLFISDALHNRIRRVDAVTNVITTFAGSGSTGFCGEGVLATNACIYHPRGIKFDADFTGAGGPVTYTATTLTDTTKSLATDSLTGRLVIAGASTGVVASNTATQITLTGGGWTVGTPVNGTSYRISGDLYIADESNNRIRRVDAGTNMITTVAGNGTRGFGGDTGAATSAMLDQPRGVAFDGSNNLYIADATNDRIRKVVTGGDGLVNGSGSETIDTIAGNGTDDFCGDGGLATSACLDAPDDVAFSGGNLYIADALNHRVRMVTPGGIISTFAGNGPGGSASFCGDGAAATAACLNDPQGVARQTASGPLYIADTINHRIRVVNGGTGNITTYAGTGTPGFFGDGGPAASAKLFFPRGIALNKAGDLYVADSSNQRIRRIDHTTGNISTVVGDGTAGLSGDNGAALSAKLNFPRDVFVDALGNLYIADASNNAIREVTPGGDGVVNGGAGETITTVAGNGTPGDCVSVAATNACLRDPHGVFADANGIVIADTSNHKVKLVVGTAITTIAGTGTAATSGDSGAATLAAVHEPTSVVKDAAGNLFISSHAGDRIRKVTPGADHQVNGSTDDIITSVVGTANTGLCGDLGLATAACLELPRAITLDSAGNLYIADDGNRRVRKVEALGVPPAPPPSVGGIAEAPDLAALPARTSAASGGRRTMYALAALTLLLLAAAAGRRRRRRARRAW
jgi:sugar lactone lactonase YvrE